MDQHSKTYEQYCSVLKRNIVLEETVYHNGTKKINCTHFSECKNEGGCKNKLLNTRLGKRTSIIDYENEL